MSFKQPLPLTWVDLHESLEFGSSLINSFVYDLVWNYYMLSKSVHMQLRWGLTTLSCARWFKFLVQVAAYSLCNCSIHIIQFSCLLTGQIRVDQISASIKALCPIYKFHFPKKIDHFIFCSTIYRQLWTLMLDLFQSSVHLQFHNLVVFDRKKEQDQRCTGLYIIAIDKLFYSCVVSECLKVKL